MQRFDRWEGLLWVEVPEGEARGAVFEEGGCGFEGEGAGAAGDWGVLVRGLGFFLLFLGMLYCKELEWMVHTDCVSCDRESMCSSLCRSEAVWR